MKSRGILLLTLALGGALGWARPAGAQETAPTEPAPVASDTAISPGDVLVITVIGETALSKRVTVSEDGKVPVGLVGEVKVGGLKPSEAAATITRALSRYLREPQVIVDLVEAAG